MNLKNLFKASLALCFGTVLFVSCGPEKPIDPVTTESTMLVGNSRKYDMSAGFLTWNNGAIEYKLASEISAAKLMADGSQYIVGIRALVSEPVDGQVTFFVGEDKDAPIFEKTVNWQNTGWQYLTFSESEYIRISDKNMVAGFTVNSPSLYLEATGTGSDMAFVDNKWTTLAALAGRYSVPVQLVVAGGDYSSKTQVDMAVDQMTMAKTWNILGETIEASAIVRNNGVKGISNVVVTATQGSKTVNYTISEELKYGQTRIVKFDGLTANGDGLQTVTVSVDVANDAASKNNTVSSSIRVHPDRSMTRNTMLLEQFTSQKCGYCPNGASIMKANIAGMNDPDKITWIAYHPATGGFADVFGLSESEKVLSACNVNSFPSGSVNRLQLPYGDNGASVLSWYFGSPSTSDLNDFVSEPAQSTLKLERTFDAGTREVTLIVSGKCRTDMKDNIYLTAIVLQSGMIAEQTDYYAQGQTQSNYSHDHAPRVYITSSAGDKVTTDEEGNFSVTLTKTIPESVGNFECVLDDMEIAAFVHGSTSSAQSRRYVYNADKVALTVQEPSAIIMRTLYNNMQRTAEPFTLYTRDCCTL
ncbi:MAG: Omp28-related outer membrane protein [Candidatus Aphodosoma sp.]